MDRLQGANKGQWDTQRLAKAGVIATPRPEGQREEVVLPEPSETGSCGEQGPKHTAQGRWSGQERPHRLSPTILKCLASAPYCMNPIKSQRAREPGRCTAQGSASHGTEKSREWMGQRRASREQTAQQARVGTKWGKKHCPMTEGGANHVDSPYRELSSWMPVCWKEWRKER